MSVRETCHGRSKRVSTSHADEQPEERTPKMKDSEYIPVGMVVTDWFSLSL